MLYLQFTFKKGVKISDILVTGAGGYVGSVLVPALIKKGHKVYALDTFWFGDHLPNNENLIKIKSDIRTICADDFPALDVIIHLAAIANDPSVDLEPSLSWEIGAIGTRNICEIGKIKQIKLLILASSGSVYGVKDDPQVTESLELIPISVYNKVKMVKERIVLSYDVDFKVVIYRPATICGWSPRMRLDLAVNALTYGALRDKKIIVYGGSQLRPQLHIDDMVAAYIWAIENDSLVGIFNVGFENDSILNIAKKVKEVIDADIVVLPSNDPRSYRLNSDKLLSTGFSPSKNSIDAINELQKLFNEGMMKVNDSNYNMAWMKQILGNKS